ncbi:DUF4270 family protein [Mucilaginibacter paludis]|nr:DUF4270 family protein [Mucilaginibacter paludis]
MKFFRIDLLTLLISLFILGSCKNPDSIGLPIDSSKALETTLIDTSTIITTTVPDDSVMTTNIAKVPLAYFVDPILGTTETNIAAALNLPSTSAYTLPTGTITIDSAMIVMKYADGFYGDSLNTNYKVNVYQLAEPVFSKSYYNRKVWSYNSTLLGTLSFYPRPKTAITINEIVSGAADTAKRVKPQIRIPFDKSFVTNKFFNATSNQLNTNSVFQNYIKGLYITLDKAHQSNNVGGIMFFQMAGDSTSLDVYYHVVNGSTIDTAHIVLPLGTPHAVQIKHTYPTALQAQLDNPKPSDGTLYLQGLSGLRAKISFPYLKNILKAQTTATTDIVLNRAELVVTPVTGTYVPFQPTPRLTMYRYDIALQRQLIPDAYSGDLHYIAVGSFGGFYDNYHKSYHYVITGYIEDLMRSKLVDYGTFIAPTDTVGSSSGSATISVSNAADVGARVVVGGDKTSAYKMKLNIIYNKVSK